MIGFLNFFIHIIGSWTFQLEIEHFPIVHMKCYLKYFHHKITFHSVLFTNQIDQLFSFILYSIRFPCFFPSKHKKFKFCLNSHNISIYILFKRCILNEKEAAFMKQKKKRTSPERQTVLFHLTDALIPSIETMAIAVRAFFHLVRKAISAVL